MAILGRVENGVVVLEAGASLPEGAEVTVEVRAVPEAARQSVSEEEHRRVLEVMDRIAALPIEGDPEPFGGADHDKLLYGKP